MPKPATKASWTTLEAPTARAPLEYQYVFDDADADRMREGLIPEAMEDKWFVYFDNGWLYLHRSWTGSLIYWLKLDGCPSGVRVIESWVNRDTEQYAETDISYDRSLLDFLLRGLILRHEVPFPVRQNDVEGVRAGVYQHHVVGRAYPEKTVPNKTSSRQHGA
jgi:hypothetical protein